MKKPAHLRRENEHEANTNFLVLQKGDGWELQRAHRNPARNNLGQTKVFGG